MDGQADLTQPLDPQSPKGREVAARLTAVVARLELELTQRDSVAVEAARLSERRAA